MVSDKGKFPICCDRLLAAILVLAAVLPAGRAHSQECAGNFMPATQDQNYSFRHSWQVGGFAAGGFVPLYEVHNPREHFSISLDFASAGLEAGRVLTALHGPGVLRGRGEALVEVIPFWLADYPQQTVSFEYAPNTVGPPQAAFPALRRFGVSITPVMLRWNLMRKSPTTSVPWVQLGGGLLWTGQKFPVVPYTTSNTSRINFTPQIGFGESIFVRENRSLDFGFKVVHISNAGLGDNNPGINFTFQFGAGYSWWK
jgi:hypothetical protein